MSFLSYGRQTIDEADIAAVIEVLRSDYLTQGPAVDAFEAELCRVTGAKHAVAVSNGTAGLHLACLAAGLGPGDLAVTVPLTFVATANAVHYTGAKAGLVDIAPDDLSISIKALRAFLDRHPETKAILPVAFAGLPADMAAIRALAGDRIVIEDAAHALGATHADGRPVGCGAHADMTVFSFHPVKPVTTGEGGAVTTNDDALAARLRMLRGHGIERDPTLFETACDRGAPWKYEHQALGFNYRLPDVLAALGLSQLGKLDRFIARRRALAARYDALLANVTHLRLNQANPSRRACSGHHIYTVAIDFRTAPMDRAALMRFLRERGIGTQVHYVPVHHHPLQRRLLINADAPFPACDTYYDTCLTLPLHPGMADGDVDRVVDALKEGLGT